MALEMPLIEQFIYKKGSIRFIWDLVKLNVFKKLTKNSLPLFVRGRDLISTDPLLFGSHEPQVTKLIELYARKGYSDFLIDIGANIGLNSCQSGSLFKTIHMIERNPNCFQILSVNTGIALQGLDYHLYPIGLGVSNEIKNLTIPKDNWGGAFIDDTFNSYSKNTIVKKDNYTDYDKDNYKTLQIKIKSAEEILNDLFLNFKKSNHTSGVIKIDVEGYEPIIVAAIAKVLPVDFKITIIFENWSDELELNKLINMFKRNIKSYVLSTKPQILDTNYPRFIRLFALFLNHGYTTQLIPITQMNPIGEIVLELDRESKILEAFHEKIASAN
jgi:FkbM family methyltransferase